MENKDKFRIASLILAIYVTTAAILYFMLPEMGILQILILAPFTIVALVAAIAILVMIGV